MARMKRTKPRRARPWVVLAAVAAAALVLAGLLLLLPRAPAGGEQPQPAARAAGRGEAQAALDRAAAALRAGDRATFEDALPASGESARAARDELFTRLAPLPWDGFAFDILAPPARSGGSAQAIASLGSVCWTSP